MNTYLALLRGINVGGNNKIKMADLRQMCEKIGLFAVQTYIQSGNIVFQHPDIEAGKLASRIKLAIKETFGFDINTFVLTASELQNAIDQNPFAEREDPDPKKLHYMFLHEAVDPVLQAELNKVESGRDQALIRDKVLYLYTPDGFGQTKITDQIIRKSLKVSYTGRNERSVMALQEMLKNQVSR